MSTLFENLRKESHAWANEEEVRKGWLKHIENDLGITFHAERGRKGVSDILCKSVLCDGCEVSELTPWGQFAETAKRSPNWMANWLIAAVHAMGRRQWTPAFLMAR